MFVPYKEHIKCDGITVDSYKKLWKISYNNIPFTLYDDTELENINNSCYRC